MLLTNYVRFILVLNSIVLVLCQINKLGEIQEILKARFLTLLGNGSYISETKLNEYLSENSWRWPKLSFLSGCFTTNSSGVSVIDRDCLLLRCLSPEEIYSIYGHSNATREVELSSLGWILFHLSENLTCARNPRDGSLDVYDVPPSPGEVWGFGLLCTTVIVLCAMACVVALPFVRGTNYKKLLLFMVGLAVGTLAGSSLLFLAPEALELEYDVLDSHSYIWKCLTMIAALYAFYLLEKFLKMLTERKERKREEKLQREMEGSRYARRKSRRESQIREMCLSMRKSVDHGHTNPFEIIKEQDEEKKLADVPEEDEDDNKIAPVAWMILLGDAIHNFIDGVSLGAAFTESVSAGVSVSVAIICEELPHELGDFAVLLTAGMSKKKAVICNVLSACTIYPGLVVGIFLGENVETHTWVFAFAAGMFIYIALVDMMPEMIVAAESEENIKLIGSGTIFVLQNLGMLAGFGAILLLAIFGEHMENAIKGR